jgi:hypothetical protein
LAFLFAWVAGPAIAKDDPLEFVHLMQREGYADVAIDYLDQLKGDPMTPKEIMDVWDLEMSRCKREAARDARSEADAKKMVEESKTLLEKFINANPNRPEAIQEKAKWLEEKAMEAQYDVQRAAFATDKAEKAKLLAEGRKIFEEIRPKFADALKASTKLRDSLPPKTPRVKKENAIIMVGENRLTLAMIDFYLAYTQETGSERNAALNKCVNEFDSIFQDFRDDFLGWRAHFWHGRILQELGQTEDARDLFEEVAAHDERNIEDVGESQNRVLSKAKAMKKTGYEGFYADIEQFYLQTLYKLNKKDYMEEVKSWRLAHKLNSENCTGYQALTMDWAKHYIEFSKEVKDGAAYKKAALVLLGEMAKIASPYRDDAIKLRRELNPNAATDNGFEEAVVDAAAEVEKQDWAAAIDLYEKALAAAGPKTDKDRLALVKETVVGCYYRLSAQLYHQGKVDDAIKKAQSALKPEYLQTKTMPLLAGYLLNVVSFQYQSAPDETAERKKAKAELLATVTKTAKGIIKLWPAREEADAARVALMRLAQAAGNTAEADRLLREIHPDSKEYPNALSEIGYSHWRRYLAAKKLGDTASDKDKAQRDDDRKQAVEFMENAVKAQKPDGPMPDSLRKAQMLLAEIYSEGGDFKQAAALYKPLIDDIAKNPSRPFDDTALRVFYGAGPAFLKLGDMANVTSLGTKFIAVGADQGMINDTILGFAMALDKARKDALVEGESGDQSAAEEIKALADLEEKVLVALSTRKNLGYRSMASIVRILTNLGTDGANKAVADLIEAIFDKANNDPRFEKEVGKSAVGLHALGARLQAEGGNYDKAIEQIKGVLVQYPNALDPLESEAKIYTAWGSKDPTKYDDAITKWDNLRTKLERVKSTAAHAADPNYVDPKYDVLVNEADCFFHRSQKSKTGKEDAKRGLDLLIPYLNLDPHIRTPGDQYKEVSAKFYKVAVKLADVLNLPRPVRPPVVKPAVKKKT